MFCAFLFQSLSKNKKEFPNFLNILSTSILGRRWVIKLLVEKGHSVEEILKKESELVERIAEVQGPAYC